MGSDGNPPRSLGRLPHAGGPVTAKMGGQFRHGQLTSALPFLAMPSRVGQVRYTHLGFLLHESRRIYLRVSTDEQDLPRQAEIEHSTRAAGYYIAGVYCETAFGDRADRPELIRMIAD